MFECFCLCVILYVFVGGCVCFCIFELICFLVFLCVSVSVFCVHVFVYCIFICVFAMVCDFFMFVCFSVCIFVFNVCFCLLYVLDMVMCVYVSPCVLCWCLILKY